MMNSTNGTLLFVRFLIICDSLYVLFVILQFLFYYVNICDCHYVK